MTKPIIQVATYGTLRVGQPNHRTLSNMFGDSSLAYVDTVKIDGFALYSLGNYPGAVRDPDRSIVVDILRVTDEVFWEIHKMEAAFGYRVTNLDIFNHPLMYVYERDTQHAVLIEHGSWIKYRKEGRPT